MSEEKKPNNLSSTFSTRVMDLFTVPQEQNRNQKYAFGSELQQLQDYQEHFPFTYEVCLQQHDGKVPVSMVTESNGKVAPRVPYTQRTAKKQEPFVRKRREFRPTPPDFRPLPPSKYYSALKNSQDEGLFKRPSNPLPKEGCPSLKPAANHGIHENEVKPSTLAERHPQLVGILEAPSTLMTKKQKQSQNAKGPYLTEEEILKEISKLYDFPLAISTILLESCLLFPFQERE